MARSAADRKARKRSLRAALMLVGKDLKSWAADDLKVSETHLHEVLAGRRVSPRIDAEIDALIEKHLQSSAA